MSENRVLELMTEIIQLQANDDQHGIMRLFKETKQESVTLKEVAEAFIQVTDDLAHYVDVSQEASQGLQEIRLLAIIEALPEEVQTKIKESFKSAEDDLLEGKNNG